MPCSTFTTSSPVRCVRFGGGCHGGDRHHWWVGGGGPFFVLLWPRPPCVPPVPGVGIAGGRGAPRSWILPHPISWLSTLVGGPDVAVDAWLALSRCSELPSGCRTPTPPILVSGYPYAESTDSPDGPRLTDSKDFLFQQVDVEISRYFTSVTSNPVVYCCCGSPGIFNPASTCKASFMIHGHEFTEFVVSCAAGF